MRGRHFSLFSKAESGCALHNTILSLTGMLRDSLCYAKKDRVAFITEDFFLSTLLLSWKLVNKMEPSWHEV